MKLLLAILFSLPVLAANPRVDRIVIIKIDGLPQRLLDRYLAENVAEGARAGHSRLPWIDHIFAQNGTRLDNFYVRGLSLSAPSWSLLDTGRPLEIRGNAEYDRYTLLVNDYLNFFPFYLGYGLSRTADMPGVEILDQLGIPLLIDRFPYAERYQSFQLFQRGARLNRLENTLTVKFAKKPMKEIFDEWETGFSMSDSVGQQMERELLAALKNPDIKYLDLYTGDYDHVAHLTNDRVAQFHVIEALDSLLGRVWTAIQATPAAANTALVLVSDHGMNTSDGVYSQGYNLIDFMNSPAGGGHHVLTNRHPISEFKLRALDPFVTEVISPSQTSYYLAGDSARYPTCVMDLDGNERASISLRNNSLNVMQILLDQLMRKKVSGRLRAAVINALFATLGQVRPEWRKNVDGLDADIHALELEIDRQQKIYDARPKKQTRAGKAEGLDDAAARLFSHIYDARQALHGYIAYNAVMRRLLALDPADFDPGKFKIDELIPKKSLSEPNSIADLRHYVVGIAPAGLTLAADGALDMENSFRHIDYFAALTNLSVRNNVQKDVDSHPIDFLAAVLDSNSVLLWSAQDRQVKIEKRGVIDGHLELRYSPVDSSFKPGLPLGILEDPDFDVPAADRQAWLSQWHDERDWLRAVHRTRYSNGIIGIVEQLLSTRPPDPRWSPLILRERQRRRFDLLAFANDHWNFNVRGFNPGGNHGSFLRVSTHSVLMFAGGADTGIPRGLRIAEPYDSLSLVPTILSLMNRAEPDFPGPVIDFH